MLIQLIVALVLAGLALWALGQFPIDATIARLIRVVIIVACVLFILYAAVPYLHMPHVGR